MKKSMNPHPKFDKYVMRMFSKLWLWWPERAAARRLATVGKGLQRCAECENIFPRKETDVDHINPKIPVTGPVYLSNGWLDFNSLRESYLVTRDELQVLCKVCHKRKTKKENEKRRRNKK